MRNKSDLWSLSVLRRKLQYKNKTFLIKMSTPTCLKIILTPYLYRIDTENVETKCHISIWRHLILKMILDSCQTIDKLYKEAKDRYEDTNCDQIAFSQHQEHNKEWLKVRMSEGNMWQLFQIQKSIRRFLIQLFRLTSL